MAITNGYCTLAELKAAIDPAGNTTWAANDDANLERAIEAASRWIETATSAGHVRRYYASTETRTYTAKWPDLLYVDDLLSVTTLKTDDNDDGTFETTWASTDYILEPENASSDGKPYRQIRVDPNGVYSFPTRIRKGIQVVGSFGYNAGTSASAPLQVKQACVLLGQRLWKRNQAIFGVAGNATVGGVAIVQAQITADADIMALLSSLDNRAYEVW